MKGTPFGMNMQHGPRSMRMGPHQPPLIALARSINASRLQVLSAAQRISGRPVRQQLKARSRPSFLGLGAPQLGALALAGTYIVRSSGCALRSCMREAAGCCADGCSRYAC